MRNKRATYVQRSPEHALRTHTADVNLSCTPRDFHVHCRAAVPTTLHHEQFPLPPLVLRTRAVLRPDRVARIKEKAGTTFLTLNRHLNTHYRPERRHRL